MIRPARFPDPAAAGPMHTQRCRCRRCIPPAPVDLPRAEAGRALGFLAGLAVGQALVLAYDWLAAGPGGFGIFGL